MYDLLAVMEHAVWFEILQDHSESPLSLGGSPGVVAPVFDWRTAE